MVDSTTQNHSDITSNHARCSSGVSRLSFKKEKHHTTDQSPER